MEESLWNPINRHSSLLYSMHHMGGQIYVFHQPSSFSLYRSLSNESQAPSLSLFFLSRLVATLATESQRTQSPPFSFIESLQNKNKTKTEKKDRKEKKKGRNSGHRGENCPYVSCRFHSLP